MRSAQFNGVLAHRPSSRPSSAGTRVLCDRANSVAATSGHSYLAGRDSRVLSTLYTMSVLARCGPAHGALYIEVAMTYLRAIIAALRCLVVALEAILALIDQSNGSGRC